MPTVQEVADHLDMSPRNAHDVLKHLGLDQRQASMDEIRIAYIRDQREKAAGRSGEAQASLTAARTRDANASADYREIQIREKAGELIPVGEVEPLLIAQVTAARTELLTLPDQLGAELKALHGIDVDTSLIEERVHDALNHLATSLQGLDAGNDDPGGEGMETAA